MNVIEQAEKAIECLYLPLSYDDDNNEIVTSKVETEYGEYGSELYKYQASLIDCGDKRSSERVIEALHLLPDLVAECKAQQERAASYSMELAAAGEIAAKREQALEDRITQLQQDNHRLHEHELLLDKECRLLEAEAARWQAAYENAITPNAVDIDGNPLHLSVSGGAALGQPRAWPMPEVIDAAVYWLNCGVVGRATESPSKEDLGRIIDGLRSLKSRRAWLMTDERIKAMELATEELAKYGDSYDLLPTLRAMLVEAKQ